MSFLNARETPQRLLTYIFNLGLFSDLFNNHYFLFFAYRKPEHITLQPGLVLSPVAPCKCMNLFLTYNVLHSLHQWFASCHHIISSHWVSHSLSLPACKENSCQPSLSAQEEASLTQVQTQCPFIHRDFHSIPDLIFKASPPHCLLSTPWTVMASLSSSHTQTCI